MRVLSLFSGAGGFDIGLEKAGWKTVFQCEIDKNCQQTLQYHWPDVPKWSDISTLTGKYILDNCDGVDVVAWGSPCQDLSLAGVRAGLSGDRSGLFHHGVRIIKELKELSNGKYPKFSIWENVVGALSSNGGADFGQVLWEMDEAGACFSEWAILDAQYFGVPQRRRRLFLISCFDSAIAERCPDKILPVAEGSGGDSEKSKAKKQDLANYIRGKTGEDSQSEGLMAKDILSFDTQFGSNANVFKNISPTLKSSQQPPSIFCNDEVRKLTPVECERLMGWEDDHTRYRFDGGENNNTARYSMCGNGVASPVAEWIAKNLFTLVNN